MGELKVALVQWAPVHLDIEGSVKKALRGISEAANNGANLIVFGESWFSGYPAWLDYCEDVTLWDHPPMKKVFRRMLDNSIVRKDQNCEKLQKECARRNISLVFGANEYDPNLAKGTLFNSLFFINEKGALTNVHRKLVPTFTEKLVHAHGDGKGLKSTQLSMASVTGSICWEHWMPLTRQALHNSNEEIHVAVWPKVHEMHQIASRHYAFEGRCFVLAVGQMYHSDEFPPELKKPDALRQSGEWVLNGGSCVIGPDGKYILEPFFDREEILYAQLDMDKVKEESLNLDVTGHYQRKDVFDFSFTNDRQEG